MDLQINQVLLIFWDLTIKEGCKQYFIFPSDLIRMLEVR